jgi:hypothetical protein
MRPEIKDPVLKKKRKFGNLHILLTLIKEKQK